MCLRITTKQFDKLQFVSAEEVAHAYTIIPPPPPPGFFTVKLSRCRAEGKLSFRFTGFA
jgi:hypothetical protein